MKLYTVQYLSSLHRNVPSLFIGRPFSIKKRKLQVYMVSKRLFICYFQEKGNCPLHVAASAGQAAQVELLLVYGSDPGAYDSNGKTPMDHARLEALKFFVIYLQHSKINLFICSNLSHLQKSGHGGWIRNADECDEWGFKIIFHSSLGWMNVDEQGMNNIHVLSFWSFNSMAGFSLFKMWSYIDRHTEQLRSGKDDKFMNVKCLFLVGWMVTQTWQNGWMNVSLN